MAAFSDPASHFSFTCTLASGGQGYTLTATGNNTTQGFQYTLSEAGVEQTLAVRAGWSSASLPVSRFIVAKE